MTTTHPTPTTHIETVHSWLLEHKLTKETVEMIKAIVNDIGPAFIVEPPIKVFNKDCKQPRDIQFRSDVSLGYFYSGQCAEALEMTPDLQQLLDTANAMCKDEDGKPSQFNAILINRYKNGTKNVGAHSDAENGLDKGAGVFAMSFGATRKFRIRDKKTKAIVKDVEARNGYALQMKGKFQSEFTHEIPIEKKVAGERISFTFRKHNPAAEQYMWQDYQMKKAVEAQRQVGQECKAEIDAELKRKRGEDPTPGPSGPVNETGEEKNVFGGPMNGALPFGKQEFEEWDGPEPSGCMAGGWGHRSLSSYKNSPKRKRTEKNQEEEQEETGGVVYGSTGGAAHGHGGPGL